ncbi:LysR substrate-binding domain-containing protein [Pseudomonas asiatica]|uniref:LysR substrate-binding domain-containing protein n=1 Tax=Pseudomonas asiatica TaxID=2219225 RepID=UPI0018AAF3DE|nr:LysR substrate-binding domain-containing protein [Pseudomonas asiatica]MBF8803519.1 LysR family transcriptional regulator [Pseudomonas asiatica]
MSYRLPPLLALRAFEAAGRHLSFTIAAQELHLTQGAISRQVRHLEDFLKQKLFIRMTRRIELTEPGKDYLESVQTALGLVENATRKCLKDQHRVLTIDVLPTLASYWLMPRLSRFTELYPEIEVRLITSIEPANFQAKDVDLAIRVGRLPGKRYTTTSPRIDLEMVESWRGLDAYPLFDDVLVPVMAKGLALQGETVREAKDLLQFTLINNATRKHAWQDWMSCFGVGAFRPRQILDFGHYFMALQAAREGKGVALVPTVIVDSLPERESLFCPDQLKMPSAGEYCLISRDAMSNDPAVKAMKDWIIQESMVADGSTIQETAGWAIGGFPQSLQPLHQ